MIRVWIGLSVSIRCGGHPHAPHAGHAAAAGRGAAEQHQRLVAEVRSRASAGPRAVHEEREHVGRLLARRLGHQDGREVGQVFHGRKLTAPKPPGQGPREEYFVQRVKLLDTWAGLMYILYVHRPLRRTTSPLGSGGHCESFRLDPHRLSPSRRGRRPFHVAGCIRRDDHTRQRSAARQRSGRPPRWQRDAAAAPGRLLIGR